VVAQLQVSDAEVAECLGVVGAQAQGCFQPLHRRLDITLLAQQVTQIVECLRIARVAAHGFTEGRRRGCELPQAVQGDTQVVVDFGVAGIEAQCLPQQIDGVCQAAGLRVEGA